MFAGRLAGCVTLGSVLLNSWKDRNLCSATQAGMINKLNDSMAWGLVQIFPAEAGLSLEQIGLITPLPYSSTKPTTPPRSLRRRIYCARPGGMSLPFHPNEYALAQWLANAPGASSARFRGKGAALVAAHKFNQPFIGGVFQFKLHPPGGGDNRHIQAGFRG